MILCHIVGISNKIKENFINTLSNISDNILILDLDDISKKIIFGTEFSRIYDKYLNSDNKRDLLKELGDIWKESFTKEINNLITNYNSKYIILIGLITFFLDLRIKIDIIDDIKYKFFVSINNNVYIKQLIEFNIDFYRNEIIDGKFPLTYLDYNFIKDQRFTLQNIYVNKRYKLKTYDIILNWIKTNVTQINNTQKRVWVASFNRYENNLNINKKNIIAYDDKWLALISIFPKKLIKRSLTFDKNGEKIPIVTELIPNAFNEFNKSCYIYEFIADKKIDSYRYLLDNNKLFINRLYVSNIKNELEQNNAILDKYNIHELS